MDRAVYANWQEKVKYGEDKPDPQILAEDGKIRVILGGLRAGQRIPVHPEAEAVYQILEGEGQMIVEDKIIPLIQGTTVVVPQGAARGIQARSQLAFLAVRVA